MTSPPGAPLEPLAPSSLGNRLVNVFAAPGDLFEEVKASPPSTANWLTPALLLILVAWLGSWLIFSQESIQSQLRELTSKPIDKQVEAGKLTKEQADQARAAAEKIGGMATKIGVFVAPVFVGLASPFWWALILWLVGVKILKADFGYMKAVEVAGLANMISVLDSMVKTMLILIKGSLFAGANLAMFLPEFDPSKTLHGALAAADAFTFWALLILSAGLSKLSGVGFGKAAAWIIGFWVAWTGFWIGVGAAFRSAFGGG